MSKPIQEIHEYRIYTSKAEIHKAINTIIGLINGVKIDEHVNQDELSEIINWCNMHRHLSNKVPFSEIIPLIDQALLDHYLDKDEVEDILWVCRNVVKEDEFNEFYNSITSTIQQLQGILHGLLADNQLSPVEIDKLNSWIEEHTFLRGTYPFDEVDSLLVSVLADGIITQDEINMLIAYFGNFVDTKISYNINEFDIKTLQNNYSVSGICAVSPEIILEKKTYCFTGTSNKATRKEIADLIQSKGGIFHNSITKKTDYLIVGNDGNPCWAFSCYGRKVEKAMQERKKGSKIIIVHENDFWDELY